MPKPIIQVKGISKKYRIRHEEGYFTLRDEIVNFIKKPLNALRRGKGPALSKEDFWALKDISFGAEQGEAFGIIGKNGAGKTTLLKILSRITHPTEGEIRLRGRVASLLGVGTGFHAELTGRENIYFNGSILGMRRREVKKKFDEIVAFSEIEKFLDTPVKRYSAGMFVRLAFAVAAHLDSEILLIDEILSIGDISFQKKCLGKMNSLTNEGRTILFVTHNMAAASNLCSKGILLEEGRVARKGSINDIINCYLGEGAVSQGEIYLPRERKIRSSEFRFLAVRIYGMGGKKASRVLLSEGFDIEIEYEILRETQGIYVEFTLRNAKGEQVFMSTDMDEASLFADSNRMPGRYMTRCHVPGSHLRFDRYAVDISAGTSLVKILDSIPNPLSIEVIDDKKMQTKILPDRPGIITPLLKWETRKI
jgi:lipopolysaccharide transport system ATP-binding protein